jgi:hypothetical protein
MSRKLAIENVNIHLIASMNNDSGLLSIRATSAQLPFRNVQRIITAIKDHLKEHRLNSDFCNRKITLQGEHTQATISQTNDIVLRFSRYATTYCL